ncbi:MAG: DUF3501 family protein [Planctomycetes bacterium]|nr:DUF3501 family protein [Planctomycetota bacterium]
MRPDEVRRPAEYAAVLEEARGRAAELKRRRRLALGESMTLLFENRETVIAQVEEMCRVEGIEDDRGVQAELDVYGELVPTRGQIVATLFIEITEPGDIRPTLRRLAGLGAPGVLHLRVGPDRVEASFDPRQAEEGQVSAVQYLGFRLTETQREAFSEDTTEVEVVVEHPAYHARAVLPEALRRVLALEMELPDDAPATAPAPTPAPPEGPVGGPGAGPRLAEILDTTFALGSR